MASHKMEINRLSQDELEYLLVIRGASTGTVDQMRAALRNCRKYEREGHSLILKKYPFTFEQDKTAVEEKITELSHLIKDFDGTPQTGAHKKIVTKLEYVSCRIGNMVPLDDDGSDEQSKLRIGILQLDAELGTKLKVARKLSTSLPLEVKLAQIVLSSSSESEDSDDRQAAPGNSSFPRTSTPNCTASTSKTFVPLHKWGITFGGTRHESVNAFIERVEDLARARGVSHAELLQSALELLTGEPLIFYRANRDSFSTWSELCVGLREEFQKPFYTEELFEEIKRRTQGKDESIGIYLAKMVTLFGRLGTSISETTKINILLRNISPYYQSQLSQTQITSVEHLKLLCKKLEVVKSAMEKFAAPPAKSCSLEPDLAYVGVEEFVSISKKSVPPELSGRPERQSTLTCYRCKEPGHLARNCPRVHCYRCGKENVTVRTCPKCNRNSGNGRRGR